MIKFFRFFNYFRLLGILYFVIGLQLTFKSGSLTILKYIGVFLIIIGFYEVFTGTSMKAAATKSKILDSSDASTENKAEINFKEASYKNIFLKLLQGNAALAGIMLLVAFTLFMSSESIAKYIIKSNTNKYQGSRTIAYDKDVTVTNSTTTQKLTGSSVKLLDNKITLFADSVEINKKNTIINLTVSNKYSKTIQMGALNGFARFKLFDSSNNTYDFVTSIDSLNGLYDLMEPNSEKNVKLTFSPTDTNVKLKNLTGQICIYGSGIKEYPFNIEFKY